MSEKSNIERLVGVATLPLSFLPTGTKAFYFINRSPGMFSLKLQNINFDIEEASL